MSLQVQNLTKFYGQQKAVDDISFTVSEGEIVGFLGPNGAGKSTTMKIITGFMAPTSGSAVIAGFDVFEASSVSDAIDRLQRHRIGIVAAAFDLAGGGAPALVPDGEVLFAFYGRFGELKGGVQPAPDDDKDGVPNAEDQCPQVAGIKENKGCPLDGDGDGVADAQDKCPKDKGTAELKGCPSLSALDSDGDGIFDDKDKCPNAAEAVNGYLDDDGCPDVPPPAVLVPFLGTVQGVAFESERSDLLPSSLPILDRAVQALRDAATAKLEVAGYTDNSGDMQRNLELSQKRADAVKAYLIGKGIDAARLTSRGYGQESPIADNATPEGREKNRRVEFHFVN